MTYNPRTYIQQMTELAQRVADLLGTDWTASGQIVKHVSGATVLLIRGLVVAADNSQRWYIPEDATAEQIAELAQRVLPTSRTYWLVEYGTDTEGWQPAYYSEFDTLEAAETYCQTWTQPAGFNDDLRISQVTVQIIKRMKRN